jgi:hypothetical protein
MRRLASEEAQLQAVADRVLKDSSTNLSNWKSHYDTVMYLNDDLQREDVQLDYESQDLEFDEYRELERDTM